MKEVVDKVFELYGNTERSDNEFKNSFIDLVFNDFFNAMKQSKIISAFSLNRQTVEYTDLDDRNLNKVLRQMKYMYKEALYHHDEHITHLQCPIYAQIIHILKNDEPITLGVDPVKTTNKDWKKYCAKYLERLTERVEKLEERMEDV